MAWRTDSYYAMGILGYAVYLLLGITSLPSVSNALSWREFSFIQVDIGMCVWIIWFVGIWMCELQCISTLWPRDTLWTQYLAESLHPVYLYVVKNWRSQLYEQVWNFFYYSFQWCGPYVVPSNLSNRFSLKHMLLSVLVCVFTGTIKWQIV